MKRAHWELIKAGKQFDTFKCTSCGAAIRIYPGDSIDNYPECSCGSFMIEVKDEFDINKCKDCNSTECRSYMEKMVLKKKLKLLCEKRDKVGKVPWVNGSSESMNAKIELARIDDLIVQTVMQMWYKRKVRYEESKRS